jgi:Reverse transcriptase (RNA-dependent DNA polymerase)
LKCYRIPDKTIGIIRKLYDGSRCAVTVDRQLEDWFQIVTGVRQGCILSPLLFLLVMDWTLRRSADDFKCRIQWIDGGRLTDLDFAYDIVLLDTTWQGMAELTTRIKREAGTVGLRINADKTKLMVVGNIEQAQSITAGGKQMETVEEFYYLGSLISNNSSCDKDITTRLGKANPVFGRLNNIWRSKTTL